MAILPVDVLDANTIQLGGNPLIDSNGDLSYNGKILAKFEELVTIHTIGTIAERDLLSPKVGDICKVTSTSQSFVYDTQWVELGRTDIVVHTVSSIVERDLLNPIAGDFANVTNEKASYIYAGSVWVPILTGEVLVINDAVVETTSVWSSSKVNYLIDNHNHDGGSF